MYIHVYKENSSPSGARKVNITIAICQKASACPPDPLPHSHPWTSLYEYFPFLRVSTPFQIQPQSKFFLRVNTHGTPGLPSAKSGHAKTQLRLSQCELVMNSYLRVHRPSQWCQLFRLGLASDTNCLDWGSNSVISRPASSFGRGLA